MIDWHSQPSPATLFDLTANLARFSAVAPFQGTCNWRVADPREVWWAGNLRQAYDDWLSDRAAPRGYKDTHVSVVFDAQFALMIEDLRFLGLIGLELIHVSKNHGHEFFAHLRRPVVPTTGETPEAYAVRREQLLRAVIAGMGSAAFPSMRQSWRRAFKLKAVIKRIISADRYNRIKAWNRVRIGRSGSS